MRTCHVGMRVGIGGVLWAVVLLLPVVAGAQTTPNQVPKFTTSGGAVADSSIAEVSGNVGIGTAAPASRLDVSGTVTATGLHIAGNATLGTSSTFTTSGGYLWLNPAADLFLGSAGTTHINHAGVGDILMNGGGNVGIGTAAPASRLDVFGTVTATGLHIAGNATLGTNSTFTTSGGYLWLNPAADLYLGSAGTTSINHAGAGNILMNGGGNVGIGTPAPLAKLHVAGDVTVDGTLTAK